MLGFFLQHIKTTKTLAKNPAKNMEILKFIEQDRGIVSWLTMPFIPKDKRWSSLRKERYLAKDFVPEEQCRKEASTGIFVQVKWD